MKITMIHNPNAGDDQQPSGDELLGLIRGAGHTTAYQSSKEADWDKALKEPGDLVAVAGGDGIVGKVAKKLIGKPVPIAVLPLGTANNIAKTLDVLDQPLTQLVDGWVQARRRKFDVGVASGPWGSTCFIEGLGMGLFTTTMHRLDARDNIDLAHASDSEEKLTSVLEILKDRLPSCPAKPLQLTLDGQDLSGEYVLLEAMNIKSIGPNLHLAPDADPGDGLLDIALLANGEQHQLNSYLSDCIAGKPCSPDLRVHRGKHLQIVWEGSVIHIDDDVWPDTGSNFSSPSTVIDVNLNPQSLVFLTPA